jgi:formiminotetrahydrofolate cyclodeaminase
MAAGLVEKVARLSTPQMIGAAAIRKQAANVRELAAAYIESDAFVYREYLAALRAARGRSATERERILRPAWGGIVNLPLKVARVATEIADMGAELAVHGKPSVRSDAVAAVHLAAAAAQASAATLAANLVSRPDDLKLAEVRELAGRASERARKLRAPGRAGGPGRGPARSASSARR